MAETNDFIVTIATNDPARREDAAALASRLGVACVAEDDGANARKHGGNVGGRLRVLDDRLELTDATMKPGTGISADLLGELTRLIHHPMARNDPLRRAVGKQRGLLVDATAGLGTDAVRLATVGERVIAIERSPVVFALLEDGLRRARQDDVWRRHIGDRLEIRFGDAGDVLASMKRAPDVIYLDPMHPPKRRSSALPRKEMQMLRRVVGEDADAESLLRKARVIAVQRVITKRPDHAPPLAPDVTVSYAGKLVRFDVWVAEGVGG